MMIEKVLETHDDARRVARMYAIALETSIPIRREGDRYLIGLPEKGRIADIKRFAHELHLFGGPANEEMLDLLHYVDNSALTDQKNAWLDPETGLTWDIAMLVTDNRGTQHPSLAKSVMNAVAYAGLTGWRLPSLQELSSLSPAKLNSAGLSFSLPDGAKFWSSEESMFSGPEKAFFDIHAREVGHQRYIEQNRDRHTAGDGYTETARTLFVSDRGRPLATDTLQETRSCP